MTSRLVPILCSRERHCRCSVFKMLTAERLCAAAGRGLDAVQSCETEAKLPAD